MFKRLVQLFLLFFLVAAGVLAWFAWYVSTPLLIPVGGEEALLLSRRGFPGDGTRGSRFIRWHGY